MTNTNETIADIIAEMRALSNPISDGIIAINGRSIADRLEAAWKREKSAIEADALAVGGIVEASRATAEKSSTVGDAAKLREALLRCDAIAQLPEVRNEQSIKDMRNIIRQALSAPPRNCNRFGTFAQAKAEWWKTEVLPRVEGVVGGEEPPFDCWLFLPAVEKKGENNANK